MAFIAIIAALLPLVIKLIEWLSSRSKPLTGNQRRRLENLRFHLNELDARLRIAGVGPKVDPQAMTLPNDDDDREENPEG